MTNLQQIARFVRTHEPAMCRIIGGTVQFSIECVQSAPCEGQPDVGAQWSEIVSVRSMAEARNALGY